MSPYTWGKFRHAFLWIGCLTIIILCLATDAQLPNIYIGLTVFIIVSYVICEIIFWRCPKCGKMLAGRKINVNHCSHCGFDIKNFKKQKGVFK